MNEPEIGKTRLVELHGARRLALDIAKKDGAPVAVVGPGAVPCPRCQVKDGLPCIDQRQRAIDYPHFERVASMNKEIDRLLKEAGEQ